MRRMEVTIKVPDKLAAEARAHGVSVEVYVQQIWRGRRFKQRAKSIFGQFARSEDRIFELRKGNKLAGLRTKDLIHEGHKY